jgi:hypothetical protein
VDIDKIWRAAKYTKSVNDAALGRYPSSLRQMEHQQLAMKSKPKNF